MAAPPLFYPCGVYPPVWLGLLEAVGIRSLIGASNGEGRRGFLFSSPPLLWGWPARGVRQGSVAPGCCHATGLRRLPSFRSRKGGLRSAVRRSLVCTIFLRFLPRSEEHEAIGVCVVAATWMAACTASAAQPRQRWAAAVDDHRQQDHPRRRRCWASWSPFTVLGLWGPRKWKGRGGVLSCETLRWLLEWSLPSCQFQVTAQRYWLFWYCGITMHIYR